MKKKMMILAVIGLSAMLFSGCAESNYNSGYNSYESSNDQKIDRAISQEVNSLSEQDIAELNKLK